MVVHPAEVYGPHKDEHPYRQHTVVRVASHSNHHIYLSSPGPIAHLAYLGFWELEALVGCPADYYCRPVSPQLMSYRSLSTATCLQWSYRWFNMCISPSTLA
ncbi:hypothetical protein XELAEV_18022623mg [Xenopus laevis]|uniref:Uncharacterized protein n=1 Tax=Xenopus laevis TaxID=8355 RepID=A0A974HNK8_XENLA|nr:hypothetical protein XELAEV_18022623mg [Xenopus laevis]